MVDVTVLLDDGASALTQSTRACETARQLQIETRALLLTYRWHRIACISGGSDGRTVVDGDGSKNLRARIRLLINPGEIPRIYAGASMLTTSCDLCRKPIARGSIEYEVEFTALTVRLDRACFELWQDEVFRTKQQKA